MDRENAQASSWLKKLVVTYSNFLFSDLRLEKDYGKSERVYSGNGKEIQI